MPNTYTVDRLTDTNELDGNGFIGSLRYCITQAQSNDTINASNELRNSTLLLNDSIIITNKQLNINLNNLIIDAKNIGNDKNAIYLIKSETRFSNIIIRNTPSGSAIFSDSPLSLLHSMLFNNNSPDCGGGIFSIANVNIVDSVIEGNKATNMGGGVYCTKNVSILNSKIIRNTAYEGGGVYNGSNKSTDVDSSFFIIGTVIAGNSAFGGLGGGLSCKTNAHGHLYNSLLACNRATNGWACYFNGSDEGSNVSIINCTIGGNRAISESIVADAAIITTISTTIQNCIISQNKYTGTNAFDVYANSFNTTLANCIIGKVWPNEYLQDLGYCIISDSNNFIQNPNNELLWRDDLVDDCDFHLTENNIGTSKGNAQYYGNAQYDIEGNIRRKPDTAIGCYEHIVADSYYIGGETGSLCDPNDWSAHRFTVENKIPGPNDTIYIGPNKNISETNVSIIEPFMNYTTETTR